MQELNRKIIMLVSHSTHHDNCHQFSSSLLCHFRKHRGNWMRDAQRMHQNCLSLEGKNIGHKKCDSCDAERKHILCIVVATKVSGSQTCLLNFLLTKKPWHLSRSLTSSGCLWWCWCVTKDYIQSLHMRLTWNCHNKFGDSMERLTKNSETRNAPEGSEINFDIKLVPDSSCFHI